MEGYTLLIPGCFCVCVCHINATPLNICEFLSTVFLQGLEYVHIVSLSRFAHLINETAVVI